MRHLARDPQRRFPALVPLTLLLAGCATYRAAPADPAGQLPRYYARRLDDPGLLAWRDSLAQSGAGPVRGLALAAEYFRPGRDRWLAELREAEAGLVTAGARPSPGAGTDLEYAVHDPQADSRWVIGISAIFTLELGGKRAARIAGAEARRTLTRTRIDEQRWSQAQRVYKAALRAVLADRQASAAQVELAALDTVVEAARARYADGAAGRLDLARVESERNAAVAEYAAVGRERTAASAELAAAVGVPPDALAGVDLRWDAGGGCALADSSDGSTRGRRALEARPSIWRAAAAYLVAEAELRGQVARASPDLELGPGLVFDQGSGKLTLAGMLPSIPFNRNRGPIAEAEARRAAAGAALAESQEQVLAEVESARARCRAAHAALAATDSLAAGASRSLELAEAAWGRGELGRLDLAQARLLSARTRRLSITARGELETAGLELERSLGAWGRLADGAWPAVQSAAGMKEGQ